MREWLRKIRKMRNMSQKEVAFKCGISRQFFSMIENGDRTPSVDTAKAIATVMGFSWTMFFEPDIKEFRID